MQPYGTHPTIRSLKIQGRRACLVWPSEEQGRAIYRENADALLVVEYPRGIKIEGTYGQLMIIADKNHILQIGRTLRFLPMTDQSGAGKPGK